MPLTMTAEREAEIYKGSPYAPNQSSFYLTAWQDLKAELEATRAAHQETQAKLEKKNLTTFKPCSVCFTSSWEPTGDGERCSYCWLHQTLAETQAKLAGAHENADALLVRLGGDPEGKSDAEVWHASAKAIKETQAIARELQEAHGIDGLCPCCATDYRATHSDSCKLNRAIAKAKDGAPSSANASITTR